MKREQFTVVCSVCGQEGVGNVRTAAAEWDANKQVTHTDPRVCRDNLSRLTERLTGPTSNE